VSSLSDTIQGTSRPSARSSKDTLGRIGLIGKGALYVIVGLLALRLATGDLGADTSKDGAIEWLAHQPFGRFLLVALTIALFALAAWRLWDAAVGDPVEGDEPKDRVRFAAKGLLYLFFAVLALTTTIATWSSDPTDGSGAGGGDQEQQQATAAVLEWPGGRYLVIAAGLAFVAYAIYMFKRHAMDSTFLERLDVGSSSWLEPVGRAGYAARSAVFVLIGWWLVQAGVTYDPEKSQTTSGALKQLAGETWGVVALWVVGIGLIAYGLFNVAESVHRRAA
jgi:hypothetical protein